MAAAALPGLRVWVPLDEGLAVLSCVESKTDQTCWLFFIPGSASREYSLQDVRQTASPYVPSVQPPT